MFTRHVILYTDLAGVRVVPSVARRTSGANGSCLSDLFLVKVSLVCCGAVIISSWKDLRCTWPVRETRRENNKRACPVFKS